MRKATEHATPTTTGIRNIYSEITPAELIRGIVTENGILNPKDVLPVVETLASYVKVLG